MTTQRSLLGDFKLVFWVTKLIIKGFLCVPSCNHRIHQQTAAALSLHSSLHSYVVSLCSLQIWLLQTCRHPAEKNFSQTPQESHNAAGANPTGPPCGRRPGIVALTALPNQTVTPCDGRTGWASRRHPAPPAGVGHSSELRYFWQADYVMSRDGFANPAACVRVLECVRAMIWSPGTVAVSCEHACCST